MKIKIGGIGYSLDDGMPIMIVMSQSDKHNIANMIEGATKYAMFCDDDLSNASEWMSQDGSPAGYHKESFYDSSTHTTYYVPPIGSVWRHYNGIVYCVHEHTNTQNGRQDKYPFMVSYHNVVTGARYSRVLRSWQGSFVRVIKPISELDND